MNLNKQIWIFISLILVAIVIMIAQYASIHKLRGELEINKSDLKKKDKEIKVSIDSLQGLKEKAVKKDEEWVLIVNMNRDSLRIEREATNKLRKKYEQIKNTPVPRWTDHQLDSIISTIIR